MNKTISILLFVLLSAKTASAAPVAVSVTAFQNKVGTSTCATDWAWWHDHLGSAFQDMLITQLSENPQIEIMEREQIKEIYQGEHELVNSEESDIQIEKKKFTKARYTFVGAVSEYEYCSSGTGGGLRLPVEGLLGSVGVRFKKSNAKVKVDLRLIDTRTGRIVKSVSAEGTADRHALGFETDVMDFENQKRSPVGEAARQAIETASAKLVPYVK